MPRPVRYSPSRSDRARPSADPAAPESPPPRPAPVAPRQRLPSAQQAQWAAMALLAMLLAGGMWWLRPVPAPHITQKAIDAAVLHTLENHTLPSAAARAAEAVVPSVVRVMGFTTTKRGKEVERSVGTGVVIVDTGIILTNLHVVRGAVHVNGRPLSAGDAALLADEPIIALDHGQDAEVLVFDLAA